MGATVPLTTQPRERVFPSAIELNLELCRRIVDASTSAVAQKDTFSIVLTGGRSVGHLYELLREKDLAWGKWRVYWGDERCLPADHPERNSRLAMDTWLNHVPIPRSSIFVIPAEQGAARAATLYRDQIKAVDCFDCVVLSLGEDGHVSSLFPGADLECVFPVTPVFDAPKPPRQRVSLSLRRLACSREVALLAIGDSKRAALNACRAGITVSGAAISRLPHTTVWCDAAAAGAGTIPAVE